jgi:aspergillopepsin I
LNFDTGSADLWVNTQETPATQQSGQLEYNPTLSSTSSKLENATWDITYGDGSAVGGSVYMDKVSIGGVTVTSQAVESAQTISASFQKDAAASGILGLSFNTLNTVKPVKQNTFFDNAMNDLASPVFTANLKKQEEGNYNFGYINQSEYTGQITYTDVDNSRGFWGFNPSGYQVGNQAFNGTSWFAIADTGTSLLLLPTDMVHIYWSAVAGAAFDTSQGGYTYPCNNTPPAFTFGVGDYRGVIPGNFMNYAQISTTHCYGGIQTSAGIGFSIFGDVALKAQFVVFDGGDERLGWANKDLS